MLTTDSPTHVVIAGGGVAAVELALALHALAGPRVRMTLIAPQPDFELRALRTAEPFSADHLRRHSLADLAERVGARLIADRVLAVDGDRHELRLAESGILGYDTLVLATGARHRTAYARAITFTGEAESQDYHGLLADLDGHWTRSVAFVVPPGTTWPLPLYELALMTAREVHAMGIDDARLQLVSPEATPLALFGPEASQAVADLLARAKVTFTGNTYARPGADGRLELLPGGDRLDAERVVALPTIEGVPIGGVPGDDRGFIPPTRTVASEAWPTSTPPATARRFPSSRAGWPASKPMRSLSCSRPPPAPTSSPRLSGPCCADACSPVAARSSSSTRWPAGAAPVPAQSCVCGRRTARSMAATSRLGSPSSTA